MKIIVALICLFLLSPLSNANADDIRNLESLIDENKCELDSGFVLWDSQQCILESGFFEVNGEGVVQTRFHLNGKLFLLKQQVDRAISGRLFVGAGIKLIIQLTPLPGCDTSDNQCEFRNYLAHFELQRIGKPTIRFQGVGFEGS